MRLIKPFFEKQISKQEKRKNFPFRFDESFRPEKKTFGERKASFRHCKIFARRKVFRKFFFQKVF